MTGARIAEILGPLPVDLAMHGACRDAEDLDLWHSVIWADQLAAKAICEGCGVRQLCADWAIDTGQPYGIWGGLDGEERAAIREGKKPVVGLRHPRRREHRLTCAWCEVTFVGKIERKYCGHSCAATHAAVMRRTVVAA